LSEVTAIQKKGKNTVMAPQATTRAATQRHRPKRDDPLCEKDATVICRLDRSASSSSAFCQLPAAS
jgi:hypothetical protein